MNTQSCSHLARIAACAASLILLPRCNERPPVPAAPVAAAAPAPKPVVAAAPATPVLPHLPSVTPPAYGERAAEFAALEKIADAYRRFRTDTGEWPRALSEWNVSTDMQIDGMSFDQNDTALFTRPANLSACGANPAGACWGGPYLTGKSLADPAWLDQWSHARFVTLLRPVDGHGGGASGAPDGLVLLWSAGPDGRDGFSCSDGGCARNWSRMAAAQPSNPNADDVVTVVGTTR